MAATQTEVWQGGTVALNVRLTADIKRIEFDLDQPTAVPPGAHVTLRLDIDGTVDRRSYSIVDSSADGRRVALSVFESPTSRGGAAVMHALEPGARVEITQPKNNFPLGHGAPRYVLLAGGVGVTVILAMADALRAVGANYSFVYVGRSREAMAYLDRIQRDHGDRLALHVDDEGSGLSVADLVDDVAAGVSGTELYVCGPIRLMDAVRRVWQDRALPPANLRMETFGNSGWFTPESFTVRIPGQGIETVVGPGQSMLEALQAAGADMMYDCRKGECGLCEVAVADLQGDIDHRDVFYSERQKDARSKMCACVSRVVAPGAQGCGLVTIVTT